MIIFYSGSRSKNVSPESLKTKHGIGFMLTYSELHKKSKRGDTIQRFKEHILRMKKHGHKKSQSSI